MAREPAAVLTVYRVREALINSPLNYQSMKKAKCDFAFFFIFNHLSVTENGGTSLCRGNPELIRVSFGRNVLFQADPEGCALLA